MLFKATDDQVKVMVQSALKSMGIELPKKAIWIDRMGPKAGISIDSLLGKKVALRLKKMAKVIWYVPDKDPPKSAGWTSSYKTYKDLVSSVEGVEIFGPVDSSTDPEDVQALAVDPKYLEKIAARQAAKKESQAAKKEDKAPKEEPKPEPKPEPAKPKAPAKKATTRKQ